MSGSIINNEGFKKQFGNRHADGSYVINTSWSKQIFLFHVVR